MFLPLACFKVSSGKCAKAASHRSLQRMNSLPGPIYKWCCVADAVDENGVVVLSKVHGDAQADRDPLQIVDGKTLDLTESSGWMEYIERTENRLDEDGGAGAYDTIRCDLRLHCDRPSEQWKVWGEDFHLLRLQNSFHALLGPNNSVEGTVYDQALKKSHVVINRLLVEAQQAKILRPLPDPEGHQISWQDIQIQIIRLTLLWSLDRNLGPKSIIVRGHACSSACSLLLHTPMTPIVASIAANTHDHGKTAWVDGNLPTRFENSQCKIASWTRLRKEMEKPDAFKPPGVAEVLMVRPTGGGAHLELLEGLSSNVFVVYKDGTLRTAPDGVLFGYVRHLVLDCAPSCGLQVDRRPILLRDAIDGLWQEVFITSSSRLIYPVSKILIHSDGEAIFEEYWKDTILTTNQPTHNAKWRLLLDEILRRAGYLQLC